jgi:putative redox protein
MNVANEIIVSENASHQLVGRKGSTEFPIGGPLHGAKGPNPYDLLSASLGACTAMTIRVHAARKHYPLSDVSVAVSFQHGADGKRDTFMRTIKLEGSLDEAQRANILQMANSCPVGKTLGLAADIVTDLGEEVARRVQDQIKNYDQDVDELSIPNIDPD